MIHFDVHGSVLTYKQFQSIQKEPQINSHQYKSYAHKKIQPYEGVKAFLSFEVDVDEEDKKKQSDLVEASELAALLVTHQIPITILNACQSGKQIGDRETSLGSQLIKEGVQLVLAIGYSVNVRAAELLMSTLYRQLFASDELLVAIRHARNELYNDKQRNAYFDQYIDLEDWLLPVVYQNQPIALQPREFTPPERAAWFEREAEKKRYTPSEPQYGFVGRDIDILHIEKRLLTRRNVLLVRGMGGAGKTTLLKHLGGWWHTTGFVQRIFYFGYDERAWTLQQIMTEMAQKLYGAKYYTDFQPLSPAAQQAMLAQELRSHNHLLILDNLESITGAQLAIQHTLPADEQQALRSFLTDLTINAPSKKSTLVLLGSRGGEDWLAKHTFEDNIYDLPGLDDEAASTLADRILESNNATKYRQDPDLRQLLKLLDGYPLALEVVLANLAHQTPTEVLNALQAGDKKIDKDINDGSEKEPESIFLEKTESILRCIDYSHNNLSQEAQQLLLCLAPFTSVFWTDKNILNNYINELRQQSALAALPFERMMEVLREAQNWGLLSSDPDIPGFLRLQPILPYFLRNRLYTPEQAEARKAIETAFRQHYDQLGAMLYQLLQSKDLKERQAGQLLIGLEYENLVTALNLALKAQVSIRNAYFALFHYLISIQDWQRGLELSQKTREGLESYTPDKLIGSLGGNLAIVINRIASTQIQLKQYGAAEASYKSELSIWEKIESYDPKVIKQNVASIYHQLGRVAQEQRQWPLAEAYYQQALQLKIEFHDRYSQASTYHQLGSVAQAQRQWPLAEAYYQQALQLKIEFHDRYSQASTYHQLGRVAQEQQLWQQARDYFLTALQIYMEYKDNFSGGVVLRSLARLWKTSGDANLPTAIAPLVGASVEETEKLLREMLEGDKTGE